MENDSVKVKIKTVMTEQTLDAILGQLRDYMSGLLGVKRLAGFTLTKSQKSRLVKASIHLNSLLEDSKTSGLSDFEKGIKWLDAMDKFFHALIPDIPRKVPFMDFAISISKQSVERSLNVFARTNTKFSEYLASLEVIIKGLYIKGKMNDVNEYLDSVSKSEDSYILVQSFLIRSLKHYNYLYKPVKAITRGRIQKMADVYDELAGHFEKQVRILIGLHEIMKGNKPDYDRIRKKSLGENLEILGDSLPPFRALISPFRKIVRNALAHKSFIIYASANTIKFVDHSKEIVLTYEQFVNETIELSAVVFALLQIQTLKGLYGFELIMPKLRPYLNSHRSQVC